MMSNRPLSSLKLASLALAVGGMAVSVQAAAQYNQVLNNDMAKCSAAGPAIKVTVNGNGKADIGQDGGAMSNNPDINILNLGKPSYEKTAFSVGAGVTAISINMKYF